MRYDRKQMKLSAKEAVKLTAPKAISVTLVFWLLTTVLSGLLEVLVPNPFSKILSVLTTYPELLEENPELLLSLLSGVGGTAAITVFVSIVLSLYRMVMGYSYNGYALKVYRRENPGYGELLSAFPKAATVIGSVFMTILYSILWVLLAMVGFSAVVLLVSYLLGDSALSFVIFCLAYVGLILYLFWALYRYVLVPYFVMDRNMTTFEAIRASRDAMRGNKGKLFVLELSFLGWELLVALISGVVVVLGLAISGGLFGNGIANVLSGAMSPASMLASGSLVLVLAGLVSVLLTLPLELWLTAYQSVSSAGFYVCLMEYRSQIRDSENTSFNVAEGSTEGDFSWEPTPSCSEPTLSHPDPIPAEPPVPEEENPAEPPEEPEQPPVLPPDFEE